MTEGTSPGPLRAVLVAVEGVLAPFESVRAWQWAWRPQGPLLGERRTQTILRRAERGWDQRRWAGVVGRAAPSDQAALREHLAGTLAAIAGHPLPAAETDAVVRRMLRPTGEVERYEEVPAEIERLRASGLAIGAASVLPSESARWLLHRVGLDAVPLLAHGDDPAATLPAPEPFRSAAGGLGAEPASTVFVGSLYWSDVRAAQRAGLRGWLIDRRNLWPHVRSGRSGSLAGLTAALREPGPPGPLDGPEPSSSGAPPSGDFL